MNLIQVSLPKVEGRYQLTKEASGIIKKADAITVSFIKGIPSESYLGVYQNKKVYGVDFEQNWRFGINVIDNSNSLDFRCIVMCDAGRHILQEFTKLHSFVYFLPDLDGGMETIKFMVRTGEKITRGIFYQGLQKPKTPIVWTHE